MFKKNKIKRYKNYFHPNAALHHAAAAAGCVFAVAVLAFLGWIIYPPVRDFILTERSSVGKTSQTDTDTEKGESASTATEKSSSSASISVQSEETQVSDVQSESTDTALISASQDSVMHGVYASAKIASNSAQMSALLKDAANADSNTVLVEAKGSDGVVYFTTENEIAVGADAVAASAYSASRVAESIKSAGMHPAAHVYAFLDPLISKTNRDLAVHYGNTEMRWLDNAAESGGKSWLNPCDSEAQDYIISLCVELANAGFEEIMIDGVQFPSGYGTDKAGYGVASFSKSEVLKEFVDTLTKQVEAVGGRVTVCISAEAIGEGKDEKTLASIDSKNRSLYGGDPETFVGESGIVMLGTSSDQSAVQLFIEKNSANINWSVCVPAYGLDGAAISTAEALATFGTSSAYVLYNPTGSYKFN